MFKIGFEKVANTLKKITPYAAGAAGGYVAGKLYAANRSTHYALNELAKDKKMVDAKNLFNKYKNLMPDNTALLTSDDVKDKIKNTSGDEKKAWKKIQDMRFDLSPGAAWDVKEIDKDVPKELIGKKVIFTGNKIAPEVLAHEMGHILDYQKNSKSLRYNKYIPDILSLKTLRVEHSAWDSAPNMKEFSDIGGHRQKAIKTYNRMAYATALGAALGAAGIFAIKKLK